MAAYFGTSTTKMHVTVLFLLWSCHVAAAYICCGSDQMQAVGYYDNANVFIDLSKPGLGTSCSYLNASILTAYDYKNGLSYSNMTVVETSCLIPQPIYLQYQVINDYKKQIRYTFTQSSCQKMAINETLPSSCIPDSAVLVSSGYMGQNQTKVRTYSFNLEGSATTYRITINPLNCQPGFITFSTSESTAESGSVDSLMYANFTTNIQNPDIFTPPPVCQKALLMHSQDAPVHQVDFMGLASLRATLVDLRRRGPAGQLSRK